MLNKIKKHLEIALVEKNNKNDNVKILKKKIINCLILFSLK